MSRADLKPYSLEITPKLHSAGHSLYSGVYLNHHLNYEFDVTFKYRQMGTFITKFGDFADSQSPINFITVGIYRNIDFNKFLKFTPYVGYFLAQKNSFMDEGSDLWVGFVVKGTVSERFWLENTVLVSNLLRHAGNPVAIANRINGALLIGKFRLDSYVWYTYSLKAELRFVGASLALTSPEWVLSPSSLQKFRYRCFRKSPMKSLMAHTIVVWLFLLLFQLFVPQDLKIDIVRIN